MCKTPGCQHLFSRLEFSRYTERQAAGNSFCRKVLEVKRELRNAPIEILEVVDALITRVRELSRLSDQQTEELVLYAMEVGGCASAGEIAETALLSESFTKQMLKSLEARGMIYSVKRHVPGSGRPYHIFKSVRQNTPPVTSEVFTRPEPVYGHEPDPMAA